MPPKDTPERREEKERAYSDTISDETGEDYEPTYHDGSAKNECWDSNGYSSGWNSAMKKNPDQS